MPNVYDVVLTDRYQLSFASGPARAAALAQLPNCLGGRVMAACRRRGWTPQNHMANIVDALHHELKRSGWRWDPGQAGHDGRAVLDGRRQAGECMFLAAALKALLAAPEPFGFQQHPGGLNLRTYNGAARDGFIAQHRTQAGGWFGLMANVYSESYHGFHDLYFWGDHKVLELRGRYWDVCYNTSYLQLSDMAEINLGPLKSKMENHRIRGEYKAQAAKRAEHRDTYWRFPEPNTPAFNAQARVEGPHRRTMFWIWE